MNRLARSASSASRPRLIWLGCVGLLSLLLSSTVTAAMPELPEVAELFRTGKYDECIALADIAVQQRAFGEDWYEWKGRAELTRGRYAEAFATCQEGLKRYPWSIRLRWLGREPALRTGQSPQAAIWLTEIQDSAGRMPWRYADAESLIAIGKTALHNGADPRGVMETFFERAQRERPEQRDSYLALGDLALLKQDYALAADIYRGAAKKFPEDADVQFGLARSLDSSDPDFAELSLQKALKLNPAHVPSLLLKLEEAIDAEDRDKARGLIRQILGINPRQPQVWAFQAVLLNLEQDPKGAAAAREMALGFHRDDAAIDHLIGRKLSQKYRFAEGAEFQRQALQAQHNYPPARAQLAQDLLRLGQEAEGWQLAETVHKEDAYNVPMFNLMQLRDALDKFTTLEDEHFIVRMDRKEAIVYGVEVLRLLNRAQATLCEKYGLKLRHKITVEIFPEPHDFAVRTFGMPATSGYLGVCFGKVITANSPASQAEHPSNWQAVLWHEFCHVVTLELTHNRMPRWLSEGISVYEERQASPVWGQRMNPTYREWILSGKLTPIRQLSGAFLRPPTGTHLQFAYFQSSLVIEFLVQRFGQPALLAVLKDIAAGIPVDVALERHTVGDIQLELEFQAYAKEQARQYGADLDWEKRDLSGLLGSDDIEAIHHWLKDHPHSYQGLTVAAGQLLERKEFQRAKAPLQALLKFLPEQQGPNSAYERLAKVHRELNEPQLERRVLEAYARYAESAVSAELRLLELQQTANDWPAVQKTARKIAAINPLSPPVQAALGNCAEVAKDDPAALAAYRALLELDVDHAAETNFRIASCLHRQKDPAAKQHVLQALELAPRYRAAQKLLLEIVHQERLSNGNPN